jgi:hypothetical protein
MTAMVIVTVFVKLPAPDLDDVTHIKHGKYFELAIAALAMEKWGIQLNKVRRYLVADDCPAGLRHEVRARLQLRLVSADVAADHVERRIGVLAEGRAPGRISLGFFRRSK